MRKADAISFYGSQNALARAVGRSPGTVCDWPDPIPLPWACVIEKMSKGRRRVNLKLYTEIPPGFGQ